MPRTSEDAFNMSARTAAAPSIIRGSVDLSTYPGVAAGALADNAARTANGVALQAALDWANTNGKYSELPPGRYDYIATRVQDSVPVGLQVGKDIPGFVGGGTKLTKLVQFAPTSHALTISDAGPNDSDGATRALYGGFSTGYGVTPGAGSVGLLLGRIASSRLFDLGVDRYISGGDYKPEVGIKVSPAPGKTWFYSNAVGGPVDVNGATANLLLYQATGTGSNWDSLYLGGGQAGNRLALTGPAISIPQCYNREFGKILQLNIEWVSPPAGRLIANTAKLLVCAMHVEGARMNDWGGDFINNDSGFIQIECATFLNTWIVAENASGTPAIFKQYGNAVMDVDFLDMTWDGGVEQVASMPFNIYGEDTALVGRSPSFNIGRRMSLSGAGLTGAVSLDPTHTGAAPGAAGHIGSLGSYIYHPGRSRTEGAIITMATANMTVYGQHRNALVKQVGALGSNITLTLSDRMAPSGAGSASIRPGFDVTRVKREGAGAGNLIVVNQSGTTLATFTGASSAGTELGFEWSAGAWSAL
ncbi:MAG: hypothetical protein QM699_07745 [Amaricoccus sp.]|uniref:hypothetical protein n=1 Tax=Amaricoccus sp. TaxID=1872485 RepID=UPI0039E3264A